MYVYLKGKSDLQFSNSADKINTDFCCYSFGFLADLLVGAHYINHQAIHFILPA